MAYEKETVPVSGKKQYLISLYQSRSVVALCASLLIMVLTFMAFAIGIRTFTDEDESIFHYFTVLANLFSAAGAAFMVPYAAEGVRQKRFVLPRWIRLFQFCGALWLLITLSCTLLVILPISGKRAVTGMNFWMHIVLPAITVVLFLCVETGVFLKRKEMILALVPFWVYMAVYYIMVVVIGKENGGWEDIYFITSYIPAWVAILVLLVLGFAEAVLLRYVHNRRAKKSVERLTRLWKEDMEDAELKVEAFGLGRFMAAHSDEAGVTFPMDIFGMMSDRYGVPVYDLSRAYARGMCDTITERKKKERGGR